MTQGHLTQHHMTQDHGAHVRRNAPPRITVRDLSFWYGDRQVLHGVSFDIYPNEILALIGPSGCGKSTALRCLNRMHDHVRGVRQTGTITFDGQDIHAPAVDPPTLRRQFGWVAQKPNPFPRSVFENVAYGARLHGLVRDKAAMAVHVEACLRRAHLWDEVKDDLHRSPATSLSGGQQQRLCIARALATAPEVLLLDEPTGSIDPIATAGIEDLMRDLRADHAILLITHSLDQAARVADRIGYVHDGRLLEIGPADVMLTAPRTPEAQRFVATRQTTPAPPPA